MNPTLMIIGGCIGSAVAIGHGVLMQKLFINPLLNSDYAQEMPPPAKKLIPLLLHFTTVFWFVGGLLLVVAPFYFEEPVVKTIAVIVCSFYIFGAIGNFWGTGGKHPGWILLTIATALVIASDL